MDLELRPVAEAEWEDAFRVDTISFGSDPVGEEEGAAWRAAHEPARCLAVFDRGRAVAVTAARSFELTLPGLGLVPVAGITGMAVLPTHHRRGLLRRMMRFQVEDAERRGDPVAALTASEAGIYGRFGFGPATTVTDSTVATAHAALAAPVDTGGVRFLDPDEIPKVLPTILDRARLGQPGDVARSPEWWRLGLLDPEKDRDGACALLHAVHDPGAGGADGYVTYRVKEADEHGLPTSVAIVEELVATTPQALAALWGFIVSLDLVQTVDVRRRPLDDPLRWLLADPRRLRTTSVTDHLWVLLVDVAAALAARRYAVEGGLVLEVIDEFRPAAAGRFRLEAGPDGAACRRTDATADVGLSLADLGALYLGGACASTLAAAGRLVEHRPGAAAAADSLFASRPAPFCRTGF